MKTTLALVALALAGVLALAGCCKKEHGQEERSGVVGDAKTEERVDEKSDGEVSPALPSGPGIVVEDEETSAESGGLVEEEDESDNFLETLEILDQSVKRNAALLAAAEEENEKTIQSILDGKMFRPTPSGDEKTWGMSPEPTGEPMEQLDAVFEIEFGEPLRKNYLRREKNSEGVLVYTTMILSAGCDFSMCFVFATPSSEKVSGVRVVYDGNDGDDCQTKYEETIRSLEHATGREFDPEEQDGETKSRSMRVGKIHVEVEKDEEDDTVVVTFMHLYLCLQAAMEAEVL